MKDSNARPNNESSDNRITLIEDDARRPSALTKRDRTNSLTTQLRITQPPASKAILRLQIAFKRVVLASCVSARKQMAKPIRLKANITMAAPGTTEPLKFVNKFSTTPFARSDTHCRLRSNVGALNRSVVTASLRAVSLRHCCGSKAGLHHASPKLGGTIDSRRTCERTSISSAALQIAGTGTKDRWPEQRRALRVRRPPAAGIRATRPGSPKWLAPFP